MLDDAIRRCVAAAAGDSLERKLEALAELRRWSAARVAARLLPLLEEHDAAIAQLGGEAAERVLRSAPSRSLWAVDRELRGKGAWTMHGLHPRRVAELAAGPGGLGALALASMQRNGYTREAAVSHLIHVDDPLALRLLLLRLNDVVPNVCTSAKEAVRGWIDVRRADALVAALPLLETMAHTVRAAHSGIAERADRVLDLGGLVVRRALRSAAVGAKDEDVRRLALSRLVQGSDEEAIEAVRVGLADRSPRVRLATVRWLARMQRSTALLDAVVPILDDNPSPTLRRLALQLLRSDASERAHRIARARCLDCNSVVRFEARRDLRRRGDDVDFRVLALERLHHGHDRRELVGALAVLSDIGRREDIELVRRFVDHPLRRVAAEARRTLGILELG